VPADTNWVAIEVGDDPRLVVGHRPRPKHLEAERVELHEDTFAVLREIATGAAEALRSTAARPYQPFAELDAGEEHFELDLRPAPARTPGRGGAEPDGGGVEPDGAELLHLLRICDDLPTVDARDLTERANLFYALCWPSPAGGTAFVKKTDPARVLRHARSFQFSGALRRVANPDLILSDSVDFVIHEGRAGILAPTPFRQLFADVDVALAEVPAYVDAVRAALAGAVPLSGGAAEALSRVVSRRTSYAARLRRLSVRLGEIELTREALVAAAARHLEDPSLLLSESGELVFDDPDVATFLDLAEGRLFEDDFSGEHRRADRYSTR
jgi:hypothetical protein